MRALEAPDRLLLLAELDGELAGSGARRAVGHGRRLRRTARPPRAARVAVWAARCSSGCSSTCAPRLRLGGGERGRAGCDRVRAPARVRRVGSRGGAGAGRRRGGAGAAAVRGRRRSRRSRSDSTLLERAYAVASQGFADLALASGGVTVPLDEWLRDEATLPAGSIRGSGRRSGRRLRRADRLERRRREGRERRSPRSTASWRRRGLATALKRRQIAWVVGKWDPRARHLDADGERGHAERQRAARLRDADCQPHGAAASLCRSRTASRLRRVVPASV